jgi:hypothetical protein
MVICFISNDFCYTSPYNGACYITLSISIFLHLQAYSPRIMYLLQHFEYHLSSIATWPTLIINLLFIEDLTLANVKKVTAFF